MSKGREDILERDPEDVRADLLATLAASRDLGPEMDKALVDSYMQRQGSATTSAGKQLVAQRQRSIMPTGSKRLTKIALITLGIIACIALLVVSHGWLWWAPWWLFWLLPVFGGRWRRAWREDQYQLRASRSEYPYGYMGTLEPRAADTPTPLSTSANAPTQQSPANPAA